MFLLEDFLSSTKCILLLAFHPNVLDTLHLYLAFAFFESFISVLFNIIKPILVRIYIF